MIHVQRALVTASPAHFAQHQPVRNEEGTMREVSKPGAESSKEETTESDGYIWKSKWELTATLGRSRGTNAKIVALVVVGVVAVAVAVFLLVGGPSRLAGRNVQRPPIANVAPPPAQAQPAAGLENFVVPPLPVPVPLE